MLSRVTNFCSDELHERVLSGHERRPIVATFLLFRLMLQRFHASHDDTATGGYAVTVMYKDSSFLLAYRLFLDQLFRLLRLLLKHLLNLLDGLLSQLLGFRTLVLRSFLELHELRQDLSAVRQSIEPAGDAAVGVLVGLLLASAMNR